MATRDKILEFIKKNGKARVEDLRREFKIGRAIIHRHLLVLQNQKLITKSGKMPLVFYVYNEPQIKTNDIVLPKEKSEFVNRNYLYISPSGEMVYGIEGFETWVKKTNQEKYLLDLIDEHIKTVRVANKFKNRLGLVDATEKFKGTFDKTYAEKVFYADFYSLPKFGKTILGHKLLHAKQAQLSGLIEEISENVKFKLEALIKKLNIDALAFIPPTIPRNVQFLKEFEKNINSSLPKIVLSKAYSGQIPVAQKTLPRLEERIENARNTIFVKDQKISFVNVLIIDDAIGSGSTINEVALKIKRISPKTKVFGFAIVGSYKGFDVISEV